MANTKVRLLVFLPESPPNTILKKQTEKFTMVVRQTKESLPIGFHADVEERHVSFDDLVAGYRILDVRRKFVVNEHNSD